MREALAVRLELKESRVAVSTYIFLRILEDIILLEKKKKRAILWKKKRIDEGLKKFNGSVELGEFNEFDGIPVEKIARGDNK